MFKINFGGVTMCILFIYTDPAPQKGHYRLIVAENRDEYYERPAQSAFLCPESNVIGGRDMEKGREGGMWLGVSLDKTDSYNFRLGALLNLKGEERQKDVEGRGPIVTNYLKSQTSAKDYVQELQSCARSHNAFNFIAVELSDVETKVFHQSNFPNRCSMFKGEQILGFGNSTTDVPLVKVTRGTDKFAMIIGSYNVSEKKEQLINELLKLLKWEEKHLPDPELKRRSPHGYEFLSAVFVRIVPKGYGTRTHSIVLVDDDWNMDFTEITMKEPINSENPTWQTETIKAQLK